MVKPEIKTIQAVKRETFGKKASSEIRDEKSVPAVLYGPDVKENLHFSVNELELEKLLAIRQRFIVSLEFEDKTTVEAIIKTVDFDPVTDRPIHLDFYVMSDDKAFVTMVPIKLVGKAKGAAVGGKVTQNLRDAKIKTIKANLPAEVDVDITKLDIGDSLKVKNIAPDSYSILNDPQRTVVSVRAVRAVAKK